MDLQGSEMSRVCLHTEILRISPQFCAFTLNFVRLLRADPAPGTPVPKNEARRARGFSLLCVHCGCTLTTVVYGVSVCGE